MKFFYNNSFHYFVTWTPLFANCGRHPKNDIFTLAKVDNLTIEDLATHLYKIQKEMKS